MHIEVSPWQTIETSIETTTKRRRKRRGGDDDPSAAGHTLACLASFVATQKRSRSSKRRKSDDGNEDIHPVVVITSSHRVNVVSRVISTSSDADSLEETSAFSYSSRPGIRHAFLTEESLLNGTIGKPKRVAVPATFDARNGLVFALQGGNSILCCWPAQAIGGPDDVSSTTLKGAFSSPAVTLSNLSYKGGLAYGSCEDGSLYLARINLSAAEKSKTSTLGMDHFAPLIENCAKMYHIGTTAALQENSGAIGLKRKAKDGQSFILVATQVFSDGVNFCVANRRLRLTPGSSPEELSKQTLAFAPSHKGSIDAKHVSFCTLDYSSFVLHYSTLEKVPKSFFLRVSLVDGSVGEPQELPSTIRHAGAVTPEVVAFATMDTIELYDVRHGAQINSISVADVVGDAKDWKLVCDSRKGRVAVMSSVNEHVRLSLAQITYSARGGRWNLASGLQSGSNDLMLSVEEPSNESQRINLLDCIECHSDDSEIQPPFAVSHALVSLQQSLEVALDTRGTETANLFLEAYEAAVAMVNGVRKTKKVKNGAYSVKMNGVNGQDEPVPTPLPLDFVDGAMSIVLSTLLLPKMEDKATSDRLLLVRQDARLVLSKLIRTGSVSARRHFEITLDADDGPDNVMLAILQSADRATTVCPVADSSVSLIHDLLTHCHDMTERHLVTMVHYMICYATPEGIAEHLNGYNGSEEADDAEDLCQRFFSTRNSLPELKKDQTPNAALKVEIDRASSRLIRAGILFAVRRIVRYSDCNDALLRGALRNGLSVAHECKLLSRVLLDLLAESESLGAMKWIVALCEGCHEHVSDNMEAMISRVQLEIKDCEVSISLRAAVHEAMSACLESERETGGLPQLQKERSTQVVAYSVERLVF